MKIARRGGGAKATGARDLTEIRVERSGPAVVGATARRLAARVAGGGGVRGVTRDFAAGFVGVRVFDAATGVRRVEGTERFAFDTRVVVGFADDGGAVFRDVTATGGFAAAGPPRRAVRFIAVYMA